MFSRKSVFIIFGLLSLSAFAQQNDIASYDSNMAQVNAVITNGVKWIDGKFLPIEGRAFTNVSHYYCRLADTITTNVNKGVRNMRKHTAGMQFRFRTDSKKLTVKWTPMNSTLGMDHMPASGMSGIDVYRFDEDCGKWIYVKTGRISNVKGASVEMPWNPGEGCIINLPLYNGIREFSLGIDENAKIEALGVRKSGIAKPVVFYGTSITHGGCASRPGLSFVNIMGRNLDVPIVNLGFSGSGCGEFEMSEHVSAIDASCYVMDCVWNMEENLIVERYEKFVRNLRARRPNIPIIIAEGCDVYRGGKQSIVAPRNILIRSIYEKLIKEGWKELYFLPSEGQYLDSESTVDGVHPNDWGMMQMAKVYGEIVRKALKLK